MDRLFLECAVRAALLVAGTAIVLYAMRVKAAAARHSVWTGVVVLMLLLPAWTAWGPKAPVRLLPPLTQRTVSEAVAPTQAVSTAVLPPATSNPEISEPAARPPLRNSPWNWQRILLGIYLLGLCALLLRLAIGTLRAHMLVRGAALRDGRRTSSSCAAPVTVGWLHPAVILPEHWREWPQAQLDAVLTHESEHARRRDPLVQWLALLNRALFWFHPVAWWLERHLSTLAEEACDSVVLSRGHDPREYSEYLIDIARSVVRSGARLNIAGMAMPGSGLPERIRQIIESGPAPRISRARMACVAVACTITCTVFAADKLDHARLADPSQSTETQRGLQGDSRGATPQAAKSQQTKEGTLLAPDDGRDGDVQRLADIRQRLLKNLVDDRQIGKACEQARTQSPQSTGTPLPCEDVHDAEMRRFTTSEYNDLRKSLAETQRILKSLRGGYQSPAAPGARLAFDSASIQVDKSGDQDIKTYFSGPGFFTATNVPLRLLVADAYQLTAAQKRLISGATDLIDKRFDIEAKGAGDPRNTEQTDLMLKSLLEDQFKLVVHHETQNVQMTYALEQSENGKLGPHLVPHSDLTKCLDPRAGPVPSRGELLPGSPPPCGGIRIGNTAGKRHEAGVKVTIGVVAGELSQHLRCPVLDRTGLSGFFDFDLTSSSIRGEFADPFEILGQPLGDPSEFIRDVQEQLGLKLVPYIAPLDVLVIDHVEVPSPN